MDADGQHRLEDLEKMYGMLDEQVDALIGSRTDDSHEPLGRRPGKWVLKHVANIITGCKIPDINCGLRVFRRSSIIPILSITSDRFSFSTSSLIAVLMLKLNVKYCPVIIDKRIGKSTVRQFRDGLYTIMLILRLIFLFNLLRVLFPVALFLLILSFFILYLHVFIEKMTATLIVTFLSCLLFFFFSLLADQVSGIRRDAIQRFITSAK